MADDLQLQVAFDSLIYWTGWHDFRACIRFKPFDNSTSKQFSKSLTDKFLFNPFLLKNGLEKET